MSVSQIIGPSGSISQSVLPRGTATLVGGSAVIPVAGLTTGSVVALALKSVGGTVGTYITAVPTADTLTLTSQNVLDTSTYTWIAIR